MLGKYVFTDHLFSTKLRTVQSTAGLADVVEISVIVAFCSD
jgi:hypothetical protein